MSSCILKSLDNVFSPHTGGSAGVCQLYVMDVTNICSIIWILSTQKCRSRINAWLSESQLYFKHVLLSLIFITWRESLEMSFFFPENVKYCMSKISIPGLCQTSHYLSQFSFVWCLIVTVLLSMCKYNVTAKRTFEGAKVFSLRPNSEEHVTDCYSKFTHVPPVCHEQVLSSMIGWEEGRVPSCPPSFFSSASVCHISCMLQYASAMSPGPLVVLALFVLAAM